MSVLWLVSGCCTNVTLVSQGGGNKGGNYTGGCVCVKYLNLVVWYFIMRDYVDKQSLKRERLTVFLQ